MTKVPIRSCTTVNGDWAIATATERPLCLEVRAHVICYHVLTLPIVEYGALLGRYKGMFRFNHRHGYGELTYADGTVWRGEWKYDRKVRVVAS